MPDTPADGASIAAARPFETPEAVWRHGAERGADRCAHGGPPGFRETRDVRLALGVERSNPAVFGVLRRSGLSRP